MNHRSDNLVLPIAGIVLAGGQSSRMGQAKGQLAWGKQTLLQHIVGCLHPGLEPLVVVAGRGQEIRALPKPIIIGYDCEPNQGPLVGLKSGLQLVPIDRPVFVTGCDYPFIHLEVVKGLAGELKDFDAVVPRLQGQAHPLVAVYQPGISSRVEELLAGGQRSLHALLDLLQVRWIEDEEWREFDPSGQVLHNLNTPEEYRSALAMFTSS